MLSRGLKVIFVVGILSVVSTIILHYVFRIYRAPTDAEFDVLGTFVAAFCSTILTFFIGALLFDYQIEKTDTKKFGQFKMLLVAELSEILYALDPTNAVEVQLANGGTVEVVPTHVQPVVLEQAIQGGFFNPPYAQAAIRLAGKMRGYNARTAHLFSLLSAGLASDSGLERLMLDATRDVEETRQAIVRDARSLVEHLEQL